MKRLATIFVLSILLSHAATGQRLYEVTGMVEIRDEQKHQPLKDLSGVAVWLTPMDNDKTIKADTHSQRYQMLQEGKHFEPHLLVVPVGTSVNFPNLDPWFHNVFSLYRGKRFDLGLYQAGSQKSVKFDRPGASYIFCNIHPEMSAVVLAVESGLIGISGSSGRVSIADVPAGRYRVHFWYEFAVNPNDLESRDITVGLPESSLGKVTITARANRDPKHKNKYGQDYDPDNMTPEY